MKKLWGGRFNKATDRIIDEIGASIPFDYKLASVDIVGSIAHAKMLAGCGIISKADADQIVAGLKEILKEIKQGLLEFRTDLEDIHMNIEHALIEKIGPAGGRLHTARSRNDQVALDTHMYVKYAVIDIIASVKMLQKTIVDLAEDHLDAIMPGYTHLQRAQPVLFSHHVMAYYEMLQRDIGRLTNCLERADMMPLGAGALAGTSFPIDPENVAGQLDFSHLYNNSMDAVSDRDYVIEFVSDCSIMMMHLSRFCEEIIIWNTTEFSFIELDDAFSTGSSIMPQKKNPDVAELTRGKTGRVYGNLMSLLTIMKSLPLAYNKDMQEDKEPLFDTAETVSKCLLMFTGMLATMKINTKKMLAAACHDFSAATDVADYLVRHGMPFREAHAVSGKLVRDCIADGKFLGELELDDWKEHSEYFESDILEIVQPAAIVAARISPGSTGLESVKKNIIRAKKEISKANLQLVRENKHSLPELQHAAEDIIEHVNWQKKSLSVNDKHSSSL